jgi:hypothetical protein
MMTILCCIKVKDSGMYEMLLLLLLPFLPWAMRQVLHTGR